MALHLTSHARAVAADVRRRANQLPKSSGPRALADVVLREAEGRLSATPEGTVRCVQVRARPRPALSPNAWRPCSPRRGVHRAAAEPLAGRLLSAGDRRCDRRCGPLKSDTARSRRSTLVGKPVSCADTSFPRDSHGEEVCFEPRGPTSCGGEGNP
ncbi:hypothetical protein [Streptomyces antimycoticus]|uniref:hypothetical protein n=1 Tax=Streptomyces antimycoticus TaxID=68175 RepID=UPI00386F8462